ncbi:MAG: 4a-hydroxytetrahydrobiopterin dehydratase [Cyclonatronaceae bacterium]
MSTPQALSDDAIKEALQELDGWEYADDSLQLGLEFDDFRAAISFIMRLSFEAEELGHHPELSNVYNTVEIRLSTHDADDKVTEKDIELARRINALGV